jgi:hypothetical protein
VEYNQLKGKALAALCRTADVIGMTTTVAAKNRSLLESLGAKIGKQFFHIQLSSQLMMFFLNLIYS